MKLNAYLNFDGRCKEAFTFYQSILGGQIVAMIPNSATPGESPVGREWQDKIMHARMIIGDQVLMASDAPPPYYETPTGFSVSINVDAPEEADRIYNGLSEGGRVIMAIEETFWAYRFAMFVDKFGTPWMINCEKPMG
jgi:PhnB protein